MSKTSDIFKFNESGTIIAGALVYFVITFFVFFVFVWISPSILYFVVIFLIKESIQVIFLILRREVFKDMKVNWNAIAMTAVAMISFPLIFNFGLSHSLHLQEGTQENDFQTWYVFKNVIAEFTKIDVIYIANWLMGAISSLVIYNVVTSFIVAFSKKKNWFDYLIGLPISFGLIILFNFHYSLDSLIGEFLLIYAVQMSVHIIMKSRRRYAILFGLVDISIWFFDPKLFLGVVTLSLLVSIIYTVMGKNKASLFWVQLISPILLMASLWLYPITVLGALILVIISIALYIFMVGIGRLELLDRLDKFLMKWRLVIPITLFISTFISAIVIGITSDMSAKEALIYDNAIWSSFDNEIWNEIQSYIYYVAAGILSYVVGYLIVFKSKIINHKVALVISTTFLIFGYSFLMRMLTIDTSIENQFSYLSVIAFAPITLLITIIGRRYIKI